MMADRSAAYSWPDSLSNQLFLAKPRRSHLAASDAQQLSGNLFLRQATAAR
jgi:hypothetical protein